MSVICGDDWHLDSEKLFLVTYVTKKRSGRSGKWNSTHSVNM